MCLVKPIEIYLADDDEDDCLLFKNVLEEQSLAVTLTTVNNGKVLMEKLMLRSRSLPDILFLDLNMPFKDGFECIIDIKQNSALKYLPVVVLTGYYNTEIEKQTVESGALYYMQKPIEFELLKRYVNKSLALCMENACKPIKMEHVSTFYN